MRDFKGGDIRHEEEDMIVWACIATFYVVMLLPSAIKMFAYATYAGVRMYRGEL